MMRFKIEIDLSNCVNSFPNCNCSLSEVNHICSIVCLNDSIPAHDNRMIDSFRHVRLYRERNHSTKRLSRNTQTQSCEKIPSRSVTRRYAGCLRPIADKPDMRRDEGSWYRTRGGRRGQSRPWPPRPCRWCRPCLAEGSGEANAV